MTDPQLTVTDQERQFLVGLLEKVLHDTLIEEHRTRTPSYREHVLQQEEVIKTILVKLKG